VDLAAAALVVVVPAAVGNAQIPVMKGQLSVLLLFCISIATHAQRKTKISFYKPLPAKHAAVNDFAGILSPAQKQSLENKLSGFNSSTGNVLVIITHTSLKDDAAGKVYTVEEAASHYANSWGIGDKKKNNGVLIFLSKNDRKVRIATGKGITQVLTNDECQHIIDNDIVPAFKAGNYYRGLDDASSSIMKELSPEQFGSGQTATASSQENNTGSFTIYNTSSNTTDNNANSVFAIFGFSVIGLFIIAVISRAIGRSRPALFSGNGYNSFHHNSSWPTSDSTSSDSFASSSGSFSSDSFSSDSSSSSSDSSSGSSDGGGASGSW
jgi:uncharacterized protein